MPLDCFRVLLGTPSWVDKIINFIIIRREWIFVKEKVQVRAGKYEPQVILSQVTTNENVPVMV
jgi:hypothetical protein